MVAKAVETLNFDSIGLVSDYVMHVRFEWDGDGVMDIMEDLRQASPILGYF